MLGEQYVGVSVHHNISNLDDERLIRLYEKNPIQTVRDTIDYVIAWPQSHVSPLPYKHQVCSNVH